MLIQNLEDGRTYLKATLLECLKEAKEQYGLTMGVTYRAILRRERRGIKEYKAVGRDAATGWRMYTGAQIRKIVDMELANHTKRMTIKNSSKTYEKPEPNNDRGELNTQS